VVLGFFLNLTDDLAGQPGSSMPMPTPTIVPAGGSINPTGGTEPATQDIDEGEATSSGAVRPSESLFWLPPGLVAAEFRCGAPR
jgi:hypothetical protein